MTLACAGAVALSAARAGAQALEGEPEVIADPELAGEPVASDPQPEGGEELIVDPELAGVVPPPQPSFALGEPNGRVRVVLRSRVGVDVQWQDPREDVIEATQLALFEARVRRSETLSFEVGLRARHLFTSWQADTADAGARRSELDIAPTAAYADLTLAAPLHLRLGYQSVQLGRFDALNPTDILSARDLRSGPTTMAEASEIAQPAVRLDWDATAAFSLRAIVLPFFQPHLINAFEGDYALMPDGQVALDEGYEMLAGFSPGDARRLRAFVRASLSRAGQAQLAESAFDAFTPEPNLTSPQAALRAELRGSAGELGLTVGAAREHLPSFVFSDAFVRAYREGTTQAQAALRDDPRPVRVAYNRIGLASLDGSVIVGPIQLGAELAYLRRTTQYAIERPAMPPEPGEPAMGDPPLPGRTDLAHLGLRAEYVSGREFAVVLEGTAARALDDSPAPDGGWLLLTEGRYLLGGAAFVAYSPGESGFTFEIGAGVFSGPSYLIAPRIELPIVGTLSAEVGAYFVGGDGARNPADPNVSVGQLYDDVDQVFAGLRWLP